MIHEINSSTSVGFIYNFSDSDSLYLSLHYYLFHIRMSVIINIIHVHMFYWLYFIVKVLK